ncbi:MAG: DUF6090 family protein [Eudoraea sp.]
MIKFFRAIRQSLLTENPTNSKAGRYLFYAIGEILLVVIGILIALGINNWNQQIKDDKLGKDLLVRIRRDLAQDTLNFRATINFNNKVRDELKELLVTLYDGVDRKEQVQQMSGIWDKALDQSFSPNDNTYRNIVSSGTLGLIKNLKLKEEIIDLYSEYDQKKDLLASINVWMIGIASAMDTETEFIKFSSEVSDIYTSEEMLNENDFAFLNNKEDPRFKLLVRAITAAAFNQKANNAYRQELIKKCEIALQQIDLELAK